MKTQTKEKTKLPEFKGKPLIEVPAVVPTANFLEGDFGRAVDEEVKGRYGKYEAIGKVSPGEGLNPFYVVAVNEVIKPEGLRTATPADLERVLRTKALDLRGFYEDSALFLRSEDEPNTYLAKDLAKQVRARNPKAKMPVMVPLASLELAEDADSPHGLAFKLTEDVKLIHAPILNQDSSYFNNVDIDEQTGLPKQLGAGNRYFYTRKFGLSGLLLNRDLNLYSYWGGLDSSHSGGRVVVVSGEATAQNLDSYVSKLQEEKAIQTAELETRFDKALKVLKSK